MGYTTVARSDILHKSEEKKWSESDLMLMLKLSKEAMWLECSNRNLGLS